MSNIKLILEIVKDVSIKRHNDNYQTAQHIILGHTHIKWSMTTVYLDTFNNEQ